MPTANIPFIGDQADMAAKAAAHGMGISVPLRPAGLGDRVHAALALLLTDPRYTAAARAVSTHMRARRDHPRVAAADAIARATDNWHAVRRIAGEAEGVWEGARASASGCDAGGGVCETK